VSLEPNRTEEELIEGLATADSFAESSESTYTRTRIHDDPKGESKIIEVFIRTKNQFGTVIYESDERYEYENIDSPPLSHVKNIKSTAYLPGVNPSRLLILMQTETTVFIPWTGLPNGRGQNLPYQKIVEGYAVYQINQSRGPVTPEGQERLVDRGITPYGPDGLIVETGRLWSEANHFNQIRDDDSGAPQTSIWKIIEAEKFDVSTEADKRREIKITKNFLRGQDIKYDGPYYLRNDSYLYRVPFPIEAPKIDAFSSGDAGVAISVEGGGFSYTPLIGGDILVTPDSYKIFRQIVSEPTPGAGDDPFNLWDTPPAPIVQSTLINITNVTDLSGAPSSSLPSQTPYNEPGDVSPPVADGWEMIAEIKNSEDKYSVGKASFIDEEILSSGEYNYRASAVIGSDSSDYSNVENVIYSGASHIRNTMTRIRETDDYIEADSITPQDPGLLDKDFGETFAAIIPARGYNGLDDWQTALNEDIAARQIGTTRRAGSEIRITTTFPFLSLEKGQRVTLPSTAFKLTNLKQDKIIDSEFDQRAWEVEGYTIKISKSANGQLVGTDQSTIEVIEDD
jgi:hypothetical protein